MLYIRHRRNDKAGQVQDGPNSNVDQAWYPDHLAPRDTALLPQVHTEFQHPERRTLHTKIRHAQAVDAFRRAGRRA